MEADRTKTKKDKTEKVMLDMTDIDPTLPPVELGYHEGTGEDYLIMGTHRTTQEEYSFYCCVQFVTVDGARQPVDWWRKLPMRQLTKAIGYVNEKLPKTPRGGDSDPLARRNS